MMAAIDLRTGNGRPARREDYFTKATAVKAAGECPLWMAFLEKVTNDDKELQTYLQRVAGYCLTGVTSEHAMFFLYGTGANGKGVFVNTLIGVWGDYAVTAPMDMFVVNKYERHPTELAMLRGARLVVAQEVDEGQYWAEAKLKTLTGGDRIQGRFMRQDFFEFTPQFKLMIAGNHKPSLRGVDEAIRRRIHLIPFDVTIPKAERDKELPEKLKSEWGGILRWAIDGCLAWQKDGLAPPQRVTEATEEYLVEQDSFSLWVGDCCVIDTAAFGIGAVLWRSWLSWADNNREPPGSRKSFAEKMKTRGYTLGNQQHQRGYLGIRLAENRDDPPF
jgi:putative DNA primase/helicase